jgi:hypothetical protein
MTCFKGFEPESCDLERIKSRLEQEKTKRMKLELENNHLQRENGMLAQENNLYLSLIRKLRRALDQRLEIQIEEEDPSTRTAFDLLNETDHVLHMFHNASHSHEMDVDNSYLDVGEQYGMDVESLDSDDGSESDWEPNVTVRAQHRTVSITNEDI